MRLLLDTGVLGQICHPRKHHDVRAWFRRTVQDHEFLVSEVADYELRRELLRIDSRKSIDRLDELTRELRYLPVTTATWRAAARLWAEQRRAGRVTGEGLDGDVLIAAQALEELATIVTTNEKHFEGIVDVSSWTAVP
ncbi:MAG TPA: PIN domain-containing protein [Kofleriaceae bacterium]|nr:PIN domain-containing protein [Kofleriaceae bacterium]